MATIPRQIVCTNDENVAITLTDKFFPWELQTCEGIYEFASQVNTMDDAMTDGSIYQGSKVTKRNIVITLRDRPNADHMANRKLLYSVFKPASAGVFAYTENGETKAIEYYVEKVYIDAVKRSRAATVSLICPNPFFHDLTDTVVSMADWDSLFEFEHEFTSEGEEFATRNVERLKTIENYNADNIGVTITIKAFGAVTNPAIYHVEAQTAIKIGTTAKPLAMVSGDSVVVTTETNNKHVYLVHNDIWTEINNYLSEDTEFIQLGIGSNTFGYNALSGAENMVVSIAYRNRYLGV